MSSIINWAYSDEFKVYMFIKHRMGPIPDELKYQGWLGKDLIQ